ncbi:MAG: ATP-binding protein [Candidatus Competibacter sp.]|nr:ATP-binding protein [Candidatus Competibacter sp.]MDG4584565.1 ATP-binding protein [Candidatus Competibacter sp.]
MTEGLALLDAEGVALLISPRLNELYGADAAAPWAEGRALAAIDAALVQQGTVGEEVALAGASDARLLERRLRDGRWVLVRERALPGGRTLQLHTDVSLLKQRELELRRSNADLEQFAYVASHDLQEPLRMVTGYLQLLERRYRDKLDDSAREFIAIAVDGAKRMQQLILDLLTFSRVSTRGQPYAPTDMEQALTETLANLETAIQEHAADIHRQPLPTVLADPAQMRMLLQNLLVNAIRFHRPGQQPQVSIAAERLDHARRPPLDGQASGWLFSVRDNGIGIEPRFFERIFVIFQRLHTRQEYPGTGIGLAVCKKIVERHGGRIWVESAPEQGACFSFFLPDHPPMLDPIPRPGAHATPPTPEPP